MADLLRALCNIRLDKLSTLRLRLFPPLKPFERRGQPTDIHGCFVYIAISRLICVAPLANEVELQGKLDERSLGLMGFFSHAQNLKSRLYGLNGPPSSSRGWRGRGKSLRLRGMERFVEGVVAKWTRK